MIATTDLESDISIAPVDAPVRQDFGWSAEAGGQTISIVRTAQSSPVFIQMNN